MEQGSKSENGSQPDRYDACHVAYREGVGLVDFDPFEGVRLPEWIKGEPEVFTLEEIQMILREAREPYRTFYWLAAETGLRASELCGLRWEDIFEVGIVSVRQTAYLGVIQTPKSQAAFRTFAISMELASHLGKQGKSFGLVFVNKLGRPFKGGKVVEKKLRPLLDRLGIPMRGLHAFRRANATLLDHLTVPMKVRQDKAWTH